MLIRMVRALKCTRLRTKCYSFFTILGSLALIVLIGGCQISNSSANDPNPVKTDIFQTQNSTSYGNSHDKTALSFPGYGQEIIENQVYGAIVVNEDSSLDFLLNKIEDKDLYQTVTIISETDYQTQKHKVFTYGAAGVLKAKGINVDDGSINRLINSNIFHNLGEIGEQSSWNNQNVSKIMEAFPAAKFVPVSINSELSESRAEIVASAIKSYLPADSILILLDESEQGRDNLPPAVKQYQTDYMQQILQSADFERFNNLPLKQNISAKIFGLYLRHKKAADPQIFALAENGYQALFRAGEPQPGQNDLYLVSFGDIMIGRYVRHLMDQNGMDYPFKEMDQSLLKVNDLLLANLEGPVTENSYRTIDGMNFGFFPDVVPYLKKYHFDILSQANNHAYDRGTDSFTESFQNLKKGGLIPFGDPNSINDNSTAYVHIRNMKFAFLGLEEVNTKIDDDAAVKKIKEVTEKGYKVIVVPHWGLEYRHNPSARQVELGHKFIDAGAYAVIGHHPHVVQTIENYKGHPIVYSLGNAIFDQYWSDPTQEGLAIATKMGENKIEINLAPIKLPGSKFQLMNESERQNFTERFISWGEYSEDQKQQIRNGKMTFEF